MKEQPVSYMLNPKRPAHWLRFDVFKLCEGKRHKIGTTYAANGTLANTQAKRIFGPDAWAQQPETVGA
jgi:hypothetical protein